jgi:hypothetical protein
MAGEAVIQGVSIHCHLYYIDTQKWVKGWSCTGGFSRRLKGTKKAPLQSAETPSYIFYYLVIAGIRTPNADPDYGYR